MGIKDLADQYKKKGRPIKVGKYKYGKGKTGATLKGYGPFEKVAEKAGK